MIRSLTSSKEKIASQYNIPVELLKVGAFDMEGTIKAILGIIIKARQLDPPFSQKGFCHKHYWRDEINGFSGASTARIWLALDSIT